MYRLIEACIPQECKAVECGSRLPPLKQAHACKRSASGNKYRALSVSGRVVVVYHHSPPPTRTFQAAFLDSQYGDTVALEISIWMLRYPSRLLEACRPSRPLRMTKKHLFCQSGNMKVPVQELSRRSDTITTMMFPEKMRRMTSHVSLGGSVPRYDSTAALRFNIPRYQLDARSC